MIFVKSFHRSALRLGLMGLLVGSLAACSSSSPTRPEQTPAPPPGGGASDFNVSLSASRSEVELGSEEGTVITITARRSDTGAAPPNGATVTVTTDLGDFNTAGSGVQSAVLELFNGNASIRLFPGSTSGEAVVLARLGNSSATLRVRFVGSIDFAAGFVEPNTGIPTGGETVTIRGQGFRSPVRVEFITSGGGASLIATAQVLSVAPEQVRVITPPSQVSVPSGSTVSADVRVTNRFGTEEETVQTIGGAFLYALGGSILQPAVTSLSPASGPNEGGTRVRILGDGFEAPVQVLFGSGTVGTFSGIEANVESVTRGEIVVRTPSATGVGQDNRNAFVNVLVRNSRSGFATVANSAFKYGQSQIFISSVSPNQGTHLGGTIATIFGSGFDEPVAVSLADIAATIISVSGSEILVRSNAIAVDSCNDIAREVRVVNIETGDFATFQNWIYRVIPPVIFNVSPSSGTAGTAVNISGTGFETPVRVLFGDQAAPIISADSTLIRTTAPPFTDFDTEACDDNADGTVGERKIPTQVGVRVSNLLTTCEDEFANSFTYTPTDLSCVGDVGAAPDAPTAAFTFFVVGGTTVQFQNDSTNATSYQWDFTNNGSTDSSVADPQFTFPAPGSYATRLVATGPGGSDTTIQQVVIP